MRNEIAPETGDIVIDKRSSDSFFETELNQHLKQHGITHLVTGGCMSQFCVDTNVRRAVSLGYDVTLNGFNTAEDTISLIHKLQRYCISTDRLKVV